MADHTALIYAIPGAGFSSLIEQFTASLRESPLTTWLILPTQQLATTVAEELIAGSVSFVPDHICTLDQFCEYLVSRYGHQTSHVKKPVARIILSDVIHEHEDDLSLFFSQKSPSPRTLQDLQALFSFITLREIAYPECLGDLAGKKSHQIARIITEYRSRLNEKHLVDTDTLLSWTIHFLQHSPDLCRSIATDVFVYGLFELLPLERQVITAIKRVSHRLIYTVPHGADRQVFADTGDWLTLETRETLHSPPREFERTAIFSQETLVSGTKLALSGVALTHFKDPSAEIRGIAQEIGRLHRNSIPYDHIVVAFPNLRLALSYAEEIFPDYSIPFYSSSSPLLTHSPLVSFLMQVLELAEKGIRYEDLIRLVQSPYLRFRWTSSRKHGDKWDDAGSISGEPRLYNLSCSSLDIICRAYGIDGRYTDWNLQFERIIRIIDEEVPKTDDTTGNRERGAQDKTHHPKRPLLRAVIRQTIEGTGILLSLLKRIGSRLSVKDHIQVYIDVLTAIGAPVPSLNPSKVHNNQGLTEEELITLQSFFSVLTDLSQIARSGTTSGVYGERPVQFGTFISTLRLLLQERGRDPYPEKRGVLLTGVREIAHQHYPYLFLASLNEGLIPRISTRLPFTNARESSRIERRSLTDILMLERYHFISALLAGTEQVYLSWHEHRDERTTLSSMFLDTIGYIATLPPWGGIGVAGETQQEQLSSATRSAFTAGNLIQKELWDKALTYLDSGEDLASVLNRVTVERNYRFRLNRSMYDGIIGNAPEVSARLDRMFGQNYRWSASMLETYARCPFKFYLERVVRIRPLPELGTELPPEVKGGLIHSVLCQFKRMMHDRGRLPLHEDHCEEALAAIVRIAEEEFEKVPYMTPLWHAKKHQLLGGSGVGSGVLERFVRSEVGRLAPDASGRVPKAFSPRYFEFSFGAVRGPNDDPNSRSDPIDLAEVAREIQGIRHVSTDPSGESPRDPGREVPGPGRRIPDQVLFTGKIDRVDLTPDGYFGVVDYKTGMKVPSGTELSQIKALQLPLYIHAFSRITGHSGVYGSYCHIHRAVTHTISLYDPEYRSVLPNGKMPRSEPDWRKIMDRSVIEACNHVYDIHEGIFPIQTCTECSTDWFCPYGTICRFQPDRGSRLCEWMPYPPDTPSQDDSSEDYSIKEVA
ncbi:MAG: PD-(D/E)XK nuclease family protein [Methanomicrobiales archaeon]|nr:PD-(D/E)XK nuclease family protein [Methanomicrobiales archaeon]